MLPDRTRPPFRLPFPSFSQVSDGVFISFPDCCSFSGVVLPSFHSLITYVSVTFLSLRPVGGRFPPYSFSSPPSSPYTLPPKHPHTLAWCLPHTNGGFFQSRASTISTYLLVPPNPLFCRIAITPFYVCISFCLGSSLTFALFTPHFPSWEIHLLVGIDVDHFFYPHKLRDPLLLRIPSSLSLDLSVAHNLRSRLLSRLHCK